MHHLILCAVLLLAATPETSPEAEAVIKARAARAAAELALNDAEKKREGAALALAKAEAALKATIARKKDELADLEEVLAGKPAPKPIRRGSRPRTQTKPQVDDDKSQKQKRKPSYVKEKRYIAPVQDNNDAQKVLQERKRRREGSQEESPRAVLRVRIRKKPERLWVDGERIRGTKTHKIEAAGDHSFRVKVVYRGQDGRMRMRRKTIAVKAGRTEKLNIGR